MDFLRLFSDENSDNTEKNSQKGKKSAKGSLYNDSTKNAVNKQLLDYFLKINLQDKSRDSWQKWYNICQKDNFQMKILLAQNDWSSTIRIAEENLKIAKKYEFTDIVVDTYRVMMLYYGSVAMVSKKYFACLEDYSYWSRVLVVERNVERVYSELMIFEERHKGDGAKIQEEAYRVYESIKPHLEQYSTFLLHMYGRQIENLVHTSNRDYSQSIAVCQDAVQFFLGKRFPAKVPISSFLCNQMFAFLQMRNFTAGKQAADTALKYLEKGSPHWFKYQELLVLLSLHTQEYQQAYTYYHAAASHRKLSSLTSGAKETWRLIGAYMYFLTEQNKIVLNAEDKHLKNFRPNKFLNEIPTLSKDKRGMNVPVLVFQIITLITKNRHEDAIARIDALEKYRTRYLRNQNGYRSNYFIKMLMKIPARGFVKPAVTRYANQHLSKLLISNCCNFSQTSHEIEIIPYEDLWEMVIDALPKRMVKSN